MFAFIFVLTVNGHWTSWSAFGSCSRPCGGGMQYRRRTCSNPPASNGGKSCKGPSHQSNACNTHACAGKSVGIRTHSTSRHFLIGLISSQIVDYRNEEIKHDKEEHAILSPTIQSLTLKLQIYSFIGCRDIRHRRFCQAVMRTYRCWQYYGYCRKTCGACKYETNYTRNK